MRLLLAFSLAALIPLAILPAEQDDKHVDSAKPNVNITPRTRTPVVDANESITDRRADIRVDTTLVLIPVSVSDPLSRFVTGLDKENFKLTEDKVDQEISHFSSEDAPLSVGIVFDTSGTVWEQNCSGRARRWRNS